MNNPLGPWFPDLPLAGHHLLHHTQLSPGTAATKKSHKVLHFLLSLFHPHLHCPPAGIPSPQLPQALYILYLTASCGAGSFYSSF